MSANAVRDYNASRYNHCAVWELFLQEEKSRRLIMNKLSSTALGLTLAVALSTGGVLVKHPNPPAGQAPGAYSDILIVEDESPRAAPAGEKTAVPTDIPQS